MKPYERQAVEALDQCLGAYDSATKALENLFGGTHIEVERICHDIVEPPIEVRKALCLATDEHLYYRHVILKARNIAVSDAHNWFVGRYLSGDMLQRLETTSEPFGYVVEPLGFKRQRLAVRFLDDKDKHDNVILQHRALLTLAGGTPFCFVEENYLKGLLEHLA